jgi:hypothetical protein
MPDINFQFWRVETSESGSDPWNEETKHGTLDGAVTEINGRIDEPGAPQFRVVWNDGGAGGVGGTETVVWPA